MSYGNLTGRIRWHISKQAFRKDILTLQVEVKYEDGPLDCHGLPSYVRGVCWRNVDVSDIPLLSISVNKKGTT